MLKKLRGIGKTTVQYYLYQFFVNLRLFTAILVPFFTQGAGLSTFQVQTLQSWYMLWIFLLEVPTGLISDYFGRKYSLGLGALMLAVSVFIFGYFNSFAMFLVAELLYAMSLTLVSGSDKAFIYDALKESKQEDNSKSVFGIGYSASLIGLLIAGSLSGIIASEFGLKAPMFLSIIPFLIAAVIILISKEPLEAKKKSQKPSYAKIIKAGLGYVYNHKVLKPIVIDGIIVATTSYFVYWLYPSILQKLHISLSYYGYFYVILIASQIIVSSNFVRLEKWCGSPKRFFQFSAIITGMSFITVGLIPNVVTVLLFITLAGGFGISRFELLSAYMNKHIRSQERATVLSLISMARRVLLIVLNPIIGLLTTHSLSVSLIFLGCIPFLIFFFPFMQE